MKVLLDTNAFLRWTTNLTLPRAVERRLERADTVCYVSIASAWEIANKPSLGRGAMEVEQKITDIGAVVLPIRFAHLDQLSNIPFFADHRDPFDRILIAQAIADKMMMISSDARFSKYSQLNLLWD